MTPQSLFATISNVSSIIQKLESVGLRIEIGSDFVAYRKRRDAQSDRLPIYPVFDSSSSFIDESNAFWVCAFNDRNELVHTQVVRMIDLGETTLQDHLSQHRHKYLTPGMVKNADQVSYSRLPSLARINGRVCYHGEFWLKGGDQGLRGQGYTALMSRVVFEMALKIWSPDFLFGFVPIKLAMNGIPFRYGYSRCEPGGWIGADQQMAVEEALVWTSKSEAEQFLEAPSETLSIVENNTAKFRRSEKLPISA